MTPNNILNMSMLNGLDLIAITDHNSTLQLNVIDKIASSYDFIVIPGIEVTVKEGFDVLCYFDSFDTAQTFNKHIESYLTDDFGPWTNENQVITDIYDMTFDFYPKSLTHTLLPYKDLVGLVREHNGVIILAHIERSSKSVLGTYTLNEIEFDGIEIQKYKKEEFLNENPEFKQYKILTSSDAHSLLELHEKEFSIELEEKSIEGFLNYFRR